MNAPSTGLRFESEWVAAPSVRTPELAATWSRLTITVEDVIATLVEERDSPGPVRKSMDVPTYPLAEWLALNWWNLNTPAHRPNDLGVSLAGAGDGFAWPDLVFRTDQDALWATMCRRDRGPDHVRFLSEGRVAIDAADAVAEIARFIDATVRRLEEEAITGTLLQQEWAAIESTDAQEAAFCSAAAAWGYDPYSMSDERTELLLTAAQRLDDIDLLTQLATAVELQDLPEAVGWLLKAVQNTPHGADLPRTHGTSGQRIDYGTRPWIVGYRQARELRRELDLPNDKRAPVEDFVAVGHVDEQAPGTVVGLVRLDRARTGLALPPLGGSSRRFAAARALGRRLATSTDGLSVMTHGSDRHLERVERAFAAEFLAPADGIREVTGGRYSDDAVTRAADHYQVSPSVIQHQFDNQILAA